MPGMIGADLASLESLRGRIASTGDEIQQRQGDAARIADAVVGAMSETFESAVTNIGTTMDTLMQNVDAMVNETDQATWEGRNRENFVLAVTDFRTANDGIRVASNEAYADFKRAAEQISSLVHEYEAELGNALNQASEAAQEMSNAVQSQRDAVDEAMNNSLSYAG